MSTPRAEWDEVAVLGRGGQAVVHEVRRRGTSDSTFARKQLLDLRRSDRFQREVLTMQRLANEIPGIPAIIETGFIGRKQNPYYVMPRFPSNLADLAIVRGDPAFGPRLELLIKIAVILRAVHESGVAHRDLKPENILIDAAGQPAVADFGLCLALPEHDEPQDRLTEDWRAVGSRLFIAPEMETGLNVELDHRPADFWSFGKIVWTTLTGEGPRSAADQLLPQHRLVRLDERFGRLDRLCEQLLQRDPAERLAQWSVILTELRAVADTIAGRGPANTSVPTDQLVTTREAARRFRASLTAVTEAEQQAMRQRHQTQLGELAAAFQRGLHTREQVIAELRDEIGGSGLIHLSQGGDSLRSIAQYGVFDHLLPVSPTTGLPARNEIVGSQNAVGIVSISVDPLEATYAALAVWLLHQDEQVFAIRVPYVVAPPEHLVRVLVPEALMSRYSTTDGPVRLGLQSSIDSMERFGRTLGDVALNFIEHALGVVSRGQPIHSNDAWADELG